MLNIVSLTANRKKVTWPGKVVKNLMKWLDILRYPYVLNRDLNATKRLWIHDDFFALKRLSTLYDSTSLIVGPNLYALPRAIPEDIHLEKYPHIMPSEWVCDFWKHFGYHGILDSWAVWVDTDIFLPSHEAKKKVLIYFKQRREEDLRSVIDVLTRLTIEYEVIRYGSYTESYFQEILRTSKYVIWIGCPESQGIAFAEVLSTDTPMLVWDTHSLMQSGITLGFTPEEVAYDQCTSAPYFDDICGIRIYDERGLASTIEHMEWVYTSFSPRVYVEKNFSLAWQAKKFLELYETHYGLSLSQWYEDILSNEKNFRNNFLIEKLFDVYDSSLVSRIRKAIL